MRETNQGQRLEMPNWCYPWGLQIRYSSKLPVVDPFSPYLCSAEAACLLSSIENWISSAFLLSHIRFLKKNDSDHELYLEIMQTQTEIKTKAQIQCIKTFTKIYSTAYELCSGNEPYPKQKNINSKVLE